MMSDSFMPACVPLWTKFCSLSFGKSPQHLKLCDNKNSFCSEGRVFQPFRLQKAMDWYSEKDEGCPQLLDLMIPKGKDWILRKSQYSTGHGLSEEKKLELRLGPPGGDWTNSSEAKQKSLLCSRYFTNNPSSQSLAMKSPWNQPTMAPFLHLQPATSHSQSQPAIQESAQPCITRSAVNLQSAEMKAFSPSNKAVTYSTSARKRTAPSPVVGWPPVRSFRKNLASGCTSKLASESPEAAPTKEPGAKLVESRPTNPLVKVSMDGFPIGRKVDLKVHDSYEKLALAVDELFRGLLAAQRDSGTGGIQNKENIIKGILDGSGEYTLVYQDNEGDRLLVGDVPWQMFFSTVKRLRVLKSSELHILSRNRETLSQCIRLGKPRKL